MRGSAAVFSLIQSNAGLVLYSPVPSKGGGSRGPRPAGAGHPCPSTSPGVKGQDCPAFRKQTDLSSGSYRFPVAFWPSPPCR